MSTLPADDSGVPLVYETVVPSSLQVSIVTFRPDWQLLERCLRKLALAIGAARESGVLRTVHVALVDNSADRAIAAKVVDLGRTRFADSGVQVSYVHGHQNIGYGAAHNLALHGSGADYHLVLNPDVELAADALLNAVRWMNAHPDVGAIAPQVKRRDGTRGYNPFTRGGRYGIAPQPKLAAGYPFSGVMVESPVAEARLERIVELPALDFVYLGIFDYSVALGIPGQVEDPRVTSFIERSARIVRGAGKAIGTTAMNRAQVDRLTAQGVNVLLYGTDTWLVGRGAKEGLDLYAAAGKR